MIKVTDLLNKEEVTVDDSKKKLVDFDNATNTIYWTAPEVDSKVEYWPTYKVKGRIDDVEAKLSTYNNVIKLKYAATVAYDSVHNDPDRRVWKKFVEYAKKHASNLFDKNGDWKKNATISINSNELYQQSR